MTVTDHPTILEAPAFERVAFDLYKDIHKGIRAELFAVTGEAGHLDPADRAGRHALATHVQAAVDLLVSHAEHEDLHIDPVLEAHRPDLAEQIRTDHVALDARLLDLVALAEENVDATAAEQAGRGHRLYLDLAAFTGTYLAHQDLEERVVMPALADAVGLEALLAINAAIVGSIPPEQMATSLALMLPAMNVEDRTELLGGMQAGAPPEVFEGVWGLAGSVLSPADHRELSIRLGLA